MFLFKNNLFTEKAFLLRQSTVGCTLFVNKSFGRLDAIFDNKSNDLALVLKDFNGGVIGKKVFIFYIY